jgi:hypothetical protein
VPEDAPAAPEPDTDRELFRSIIGSSAGKRIRAFTDCPDGPKCRAAKRDAQTLGAVRWAAGADPTAARIATTAAFFAFLEDGSQPPKAAFPALRYLMPVILKLSAEASESRNLTAARRLTGLLVRFELDSRNAP